MIQDRRLINTLIALVLLATIAVYSQVVNHDFVSLDDHIYVTDNQEVQKGLKIKGLLWAFSTFHAEFWHPLTWLSLMFDTWTWQGRPAGYLITNLMFHLLNTWLLFFILYRTTGSPMKSIFTAALFALHPLHVESVAWVSERKDVLSTCFWMLTTAIYVSYVQKKGTCRNIVCHVTFLLGLMAKPMIVTLPLVLLLIDFWPLGRWNRERSGKSFGRNLWYFILEKRFFICLALAGGLLTIIAQAKGKGLVGQEVFPMGDRFANALISYVIYLRQMILPRDLSVFYPLPTYFSVWKTALAGLIIVLATVWIVRMRKQYPFVLTGWLWYIVTLLPVIGFIKIGDFAHADRYTYIPLVGIGIIVSWGVPELMSRLRYREKILSVLATLVLMLLSFTTWHQVGVWSDSRKLFEHALRSTAGNYFVHHALGHALAEDGKLSDAIFHFKEAVILDPKKPSLKNSLGRALFVKGQVEEAQEYLALAVRKNPDYPNARFNLALVLLAQGKQRNALDHLHEAVLNHPGYKQIQDQADVAVTRLFREGRRYENNNKRELAIPQYRSALEINPGFSPARAYLGRLYAHKKSYEEALSLYMITPEVDWLKKAAVKGYGRWEIQKISD